MRLGRGSVLDTVAEASFAATGNAIAIADTVATDQKFIVDQAIPTTVWTPGTLHTVIDLFELGTALTGVDDLPNQDQAVSVAAGTYAATVGTDRLDDINYAGGVLRRHLLSLSPHSPYLILVREAVPFRSQNGNDISITSPTDFC